jgi:uncharacterized repeat protein (TIGR01451 family)
MRNMILAILIIGLPVSALIASQSQNSGILTLASPTPSPEATFCFIKRNFEPISTPSPSPSPSPFPQEQVIKELSMDNIRALAKVMDYDCDGISDFDDTCIEVPNPDQTDSDFDGFGDACDGISSDLAVKMSADHQRVRAGQTVTYSVTILNKGPTHTAGGIFVQSFFPPVVKVTSVTASVGDCDEFDGDLECRIDTLSVGASVTLKITVVPNTAARIVNTIKVRNGIGDRKQSNNSATVTIVAK